MNRTLVNLIRSMLETNSLSKSFWAEALETAVYRINRISSSSLSPNTTPYHRCHSSTSDISHSRVSGCKCIYAIPKTKVKKLDPRSREAIFVGYLPQSNGNKVWDIELRKCIASRHVTFRETMSDNPNELKNTSSVPSIDHRVLEAEEVADGVSNR